mmetsp:Transcript_6814/g.21199  ORF Transcript_6814/g.21199 Transcript_6814/m.21199 type:complete len:236 (+) Transcript_6814:591-1298(+)
MAYSTKTMASSLTKGDESISKRRSGYETFSYGGQNDTKLKAPPTPEVFLECLCKNVSTEAQCAVAFFSSPNVFIFTRVTFLTVQSSISTKCASTHPLESASNPIAPVPANKSNHLEFSGNCTFERDPTRLRIISNVAPRTTPIIGRVFNPDGVRTTRLECRPATICNRLCVFFSSPKESRFFFFFLSLTASTSSCSRSICSNNAFGTPICINAAFFAAKSSRFFVLVSSSAPKAR